MNPLKKRKSVVRYIHSVLLSDSIMYSLYAGRGLPCSRSLYSLLLAGRYVNRVYGVNLTRYTVLACMESIEGRIGFFWRDLSYEIEPYSRGFDWLNRKGCFERVPFPLTYSHILTLRVKTYILSPFGREVLEAFRKEYKRQTNRSKRGKIKEADMLK